MQEAAVKKQLIMLSQTISTIPDHSSSKPATKGVHLTEPAVEKSSLDEALEVLRLQIKYMVFDLEATRRENRYLRQMLESRPPRDRDEP